MNVIKFPEPERPVPPAVEKHELGDALETAFEVHRIIMNGLHMEPFREAPEAFGPVLISVLPKHFGPNLSDWAEMQFEAVYGIDTRSFINHVTAYLD